MCRSPPNRCLSLFSMCRSPSPLFPIAHRHSPVDCTLASPSVGTSPFRWLRYPMIFPHALSPLLCGNRSPPRRRRCPALLALNLAGLPSTRDRRPPPDSSPIKKKVKEEEEEGRTLTWIAASPEPPPPCDPAHRRQRRRLPHPDAADPLLLPFLLSLSPQLTYTLDLRRLGHRPPLRRSPGPVKPRRRSPALTLVGQTFTPLAPAARILPRWLRPPSSRRISPGRLLHAVASVLHRRPHYPGVARCQRPSSATLTPVASLQASHHLARRATPPTMPLYHSICTGHFLVFLLGLRDRARCHYMRKLELEARDAGLGTVCTQDAGYFECDAGVDGPDSFPEDD